MIKLINQNKPPKVLNDLFQSAGVQFNGSNPWDVRVNDTGVYKEILMNGSLGFGEAYVKGWWDSINLDETVNRLLRFDADNKLKGWAKIKFIGQSLRHRLINLQPIHRAFHVAEKHYDIGNDIFEAMLDSSMSYSCAYWKNSTDLESAQQAKLEMICRKLELKPGERLLEIGCGWGGLAYFAAKHYGVEVLGVTVSKEQQKLAQERCKGLPVEIVLMDYRKLSGQFDKIVSVGMFEHVGFKNYRAYFDIAHQLLKPEGLFLLHSIGSHNSQGHTDPWIDKYIFPNGELPSAKEITSAIEDLFLIEDWHNFGEDYDRTLMAWWNNFDSAWHKLSSRYGESFYRVWKYYLLCCAGFFRSHQGQLWQIVLSKRERTKIYRSVR